MRIYRFNKVYVIHVLQQQKSRTFVFLETCTNSVLFKVLSANFRSFTRINNILYASESVVADLDRQLLQKQMNMRN